MSYFLSNLSSTVITWLSVEEQVHISQQFATHGFKGVIGVIDGSHVRIDKPSEDPESYINRKGYYSIHLQVVCDHKRKIRNVVTGFRDSGYPCLRHLLTPFKDMGNLTNVQQNYNWRLAKTRYIVEHTFGILKQKFRQLYLLKLRGDREPENSPTTVHRRKIPRQQFIDKKIYRQENSTTGKFLDKQFIE
nr:unnamed protein product [Callosobruchus analis]